MYLALVSVINHNLQKNFIRTCNNVSPFTEFLGSSCIIHLHDSVTNLLTPREEKYILSLRSINPASGGKRFSIHLRLTAVWKLRVHLSYSETVCVHKTSSLKFMCTRNEQHNSPHSTHDNNLGSISAISQRNIYSFKAALLIHNVNVIFFFLIPLFTFCILWV